MGGYPARLECSEEDIEEDSDMDVDVQSLEDATKSIVWDTALGCLALSVKVRHTT